MWEDVEVPDPGPGEARLKQTAIGINFVGTYHRAGVRNMTAHRFIKVLEGIGDVQAAGMMLKGMTAQYLLRSTYRVRPGDTIVVTAAAGGIGLILCQ